MSRQREFFVSLLPRHIEVRHFVVFVDVFFVLEDWQQWCMNTCCYPHGRRLVSVVVHWYISVCLFVCLFAKNHEGIKLTHPIFSSIDSRGFFYHYATIIKGERHRTTNENFNATIKSKHQHTPYNQVYHHIHPILQNLTMMPNQVKPGPQHWC